MSTIEKTSSVNTGSNVDQADLDIDGSEREFKAAVRRLDWIVLPLTAAIYLLNFLEYVGLLVPFAKLRHSTDALCSSQPLKYVSLLRPHARSTASCANPLAVVCDACDAI